MSNSSLTFPLDLSKFSLDELKALQTKIAFLLELQEQFVLVPIAQVQVSNA